MLDEGATIFLSASLADLTNELYYNVIDISLLATFLAHLRNCQYTFVLLGAREYESIYR